MFGNMRPLTIESVANHDLTIVTNFNVILEWQKLYWCDFGLIWPIPDLLHKEVSALIPSQQTTSLHSYFTTKQNFKSLFDLAIYLKFNTE